MHIAGHARKSFGNLENDRHDHIGPGGHCAPHHLHHAAGRLGVLGDFGKGVASAGGQCLEFGNDGLDIKAGNKSFYTLNAALECGFNDLPKAVNGAVRHAGAKGVGQVGNALGQHRQHGGHKGVLHRLPGAAQALYAALQVVLHDLGGSGRAALGVAQLFSQGID